MEIVALQSVFMKYLLTGPDLRHLQFKSIATTKKNQIHPQKKYLIRRRSFSSISVLFILGGRVSNLNMINQHV